MSTKYIASNWRLPNQENSSKSDNYGLTFDGSSEYITADAINITGDKSISIWFRTSNVSTVQGIIEIMPDPNTSDYLIVWINSSKILASATNSSASSKESSVLSSDTWYNLVITKSAGQIEKIYINGQDDTQSATSFLGFVGGRNNTYLGATYQGTAYANEFNGFISEVSIFDYTLSESQISTLYGSSSLGAGNPMALKPQPVAYYPLGDNSASNPLTQPNEAVEDASVFDFSGSNQWIDCGIDSSIDTGDLSVAFWFNKDSSASGFQYVFNSGSGSAKAGFVFAFSGTNIYIGRKTRTHTAGFTTYTNIGISADKWHHIALTYNDTSNNFVVYLDGQSVHTSTGTTATNAASSEIIFGRISNVASSYYKGKVSNAQIWQAELSSSEITTLYNSGVPLTGTQPQASSLRAWYKLDQSANWEADSAGNWQIPEATSAYPQSFNFDGTSDIINFSTIDLGTTHTISMWVKITATSFANIISGTGGSAIRLNAPNRIYYNTNNYANTQPTISTPLNQWNNIVIVRETTTVE